MNTDTFIDPYNMNNWRGEVRVSYHISFIQRVLMGIYLILDRGFIYNYDTRKVERRKLSSGRTLKLEYLEGSII